MAASLLSSALFLAACANQYEHEAPDLVELPKTWQSPERDFSQLLSWSSLISSPELEQLVLTAINHNQSLRQKKLDLGIAQTQLYQANMRYVPELDARFTSTRGQINESSPITNNVTVAADFRYELNIWGQVTDAKRAAAFRAASAEQHYQAELRLLVIDIATTWAAVIENQQLLAMASKRLQSLEKNLSIIESGYRAGLNSSLEVYLARNDVETDRSKFEQLLQDLSDSRRQLNFQLGSYASEQYQAALEFPQPPNLLPPQLPSELLMRRPDLQSAWLSLLASNSEAAVAHKARFPSLRLTASSGRSSSDLSQLIDAGAVSWNVGVNLLQPILNNGQLKANDKIAKIRLEQSELVYNQTVYRAFKEIESELQKQQNLARQKQYVSQSRDNALIAEKLSFEQYLKGITSYTTVLDAQNRAVDAEVRLISLERQIFENKIHLHNALAVDLDFITADDSEG